MDDVNDIAPEHLTNREIEGGALAIRYSFEKQKRRRKQWKVKKVSHEAALYKNTLKGSFNIWKNKKI